MRQMWQVPWMWQRNCWACKDPGVGGRVFYEGKRAAFPDGGLGMRPFLVGRGLWAAHQVGVGVIQGPRWGVRESRFRGQLGGAGRGFFC